MGQEVILNFKEFKGLKNDEDTKQVPFDYFYQMNNFNYPDNGILGIQKILMPSQVSQIGTDSIDGLFEYKYLDSGGVLRTEEIAVTNGEIYKDCLAVSPVLLKEGLSGGKTSFAIYKDKLFIANGVQYVQVFWGSEGVIAEMGAPAAVIDGSGDVEIGEHYYAMTYVTAGGEEVLGSVSNVIDITGSKKKVNLSLPIGYTGTLTRNIYRTEADGTQLYLLTSIANNTTLTYEDNTADGGLDTGTPIPVTNNELPIPHQLGVANSALYGTVAIGYPTQVFKTDTNVEVWDSANYIDVGNFGNDNTAVVGMGVDFSNIMVGTSKNIYLIQWNGTTSPVIPTRANVGMKDGFAVESVPAFGDFLGGLMFVSTLNDVRILNGMDALPVATSINNVRTDNWSQDIMGSLNPALKSANSIYMKFYKYRLNLVIDYIKYVFDIRTKHWTYHNIISANYRSKPLVLGTFVNELYNGQPDGWIEKEYALTTYKSENVNATIKSPRITIDEKYKYVMKFIWWFISNKSSAVTVQVVTDSNAYYPITATFNMTGGFFDPTYYNETYFSADKSEMDYRVLNVNTPCRWFEYTLINSAGIVSIQNISLVGQILRSKREGITANKGDMKEMYQQ